MDSLNYENKTIDISAGNLMNTHSIQAITDILKLQQDSTESFIELIEQNTDSIKKLLEIYKELDNYRINDIIELSNSQKRAYRHVATFLLLAKKPFDDVFLNVFMVRIRDVDSTIRLMTINFILTNKRYLEKEKELIQILTLCLNDKIDSVRKKATKALGKICAHAKDDLPVHTKQRISELINSEKNESVKVECIKLALQLFCKEKVSEREILSLLKHCTKPAGSMCQKVIKRLLPKGICDINELHGIFEKVALPFFASLTLNATDLLSVCNTYIQANSTCCGNAYFCIFDVLLARPFLILSSLDPLLSLLDTCKDNEQNILKIFKIIEKEKNLMEHSDKIETILEKSRGLIKRHPNILVKQYINLLYKINPLCQKLVLL